MVTDTLDATPWPGMPPVALEAERGTLVVLHGLLPHASAPNRSGRCRTYARSPSWRASLSCTYPSRRSNRPA